jgi:hypothetical protein
MMQAAAHRPAPRQAPSRSVTHLYRELEAFRAQLKAAEKRLDGTNLNAMTPELARFERLCLKCHKAAHRAISARAPRSRGAC